MTYQEALLLRYGNKISDTLTGETFKFAQFIYPNIMCFDYKGKVLWLSLERSIKVNQIE